MISIFNLPPTNKQSYTMRCLILSFFFLGKSMSSMLYICCYSLHVVVLSSLLSCSIVFIDGTNGGFYMGSTNEEGLGRLWD